MADDNRRARNASLPEEIMEHIESFLDVRSQARYGMASKTTRAAMHDLNPSLPLIRGAVRAGDVDLFRVNPASPSFHPMSPRGTIAEYPHMTRTDAGTHLTDIGEDLRQVRHAMHPGTRALGPAERLPAKEGQLVPSVSPAHQGSFVRHKDKNKDATGKLGGRFYEPQSPQTVLRAPLSRNWQDKKVR